LPDLSISADWNASASACRACSALALPWVDLARRNAISWPPSLAPIAPFGGGIVVFSDLGPLNSAIPGDAIAPFFLLFFWKKQKKEISVHSD
jgi:hypothetical protein